MFKFTTLLFALLSLTACAGLPVRGMVGGQMIDTRVDSEVARYYVANYLAGKHGDAALDERIDRVYRSANGDLPNRDDLKKLSFAAFDIVSWEGQPLQSFADSWKTIQRVFGAGERIHPVDGRRRGRGWAGVEGDLR
jgi:hypothetical protein